MRSITFIIPIIVAGITTAFYRASPHDEVMKRGDIPNRQTFVALQNETYVMRKEEVDALVHTATLSRQAILNKLRGANKDRSAKKAAKTSKKTKESGTEINDDSEYKTYDIYDEDDSI